MVKKKRKQKTTVYISLEGRREKALYCHLCDVYDPKSNNISITVNDKLGGSSDSILSQAIKMKNNYNKVYAWFDEDVALSDEIKQELAQAWGLASNQLNGLDDKDLQRLRNSRNRNPMLIVSNPCSVDGVLIDICGKTIPQSPTTSKCKDAIAGIIGKRGFNEDEEREYYKNNLPKKTLENINNECLSLLLSMFK